MSAIPAVSLPQTKVLSENRARVARVVALAVLWAVLLAGYAAFAEGKGAGDVAPALVAARAMFGGRDPYFVVTPIGHLFYPAPAFLLVAPLAALPLAVGGVALFAIGSGLLAFALARRNLPVLPVFLSAPFVVAGNAVQWSPLLVSAALLGGGWQGILAAKPNLGVALWLFRPSLRGVVAGALLVAVSLAILPTWPATWLRFSRASVFTAVPLAVPGAPLLLVALAFRWRSGAARLVAAMLGVPHFPFFYDTLPLWLVPKTERESLALTWASWVAMAGWLTVSFDWSTRVAVLHTAAPWVVWCVYAPAVVMILRRPNAPDDGSS